MQDSSSFNEKYSLEKLSNDFARLAEGVGDAKYDIKIMCDGFTTEAHTVILITRSPFFKKKLKSSTANQIELKNIDPATLKEILRYIYSGKLPDLSLEKAKRLYEAGDVCNKELRELCMEFLIDNLTPDNACQILTLTNDEHLKRRIIKYIIQKGIPYMVEIWKPFRSKHPECANDVYEKLLGLLPKPDQGIISSL